VAVGVGLAVLLHLVPVVRRAVYPLLIGSQTVPIVVLAPILVILLGYGIMPKLVIVALICFFPIVVNGIDGLRSVDGELIGMMRTLNASRCDFQAGRILQPCRRSSPGCGSRRRSPRSARCSGSGRDRTKDWAT
jgi:ABC-type nitrate/sulfonate/bicarbonate transport system permease component